MDPLQMLLQQASDAVASPFAENSRYRSVQTVVVTLPDGRQLSYLRRRFLPQPEQMETIAMHKVCPEDRLDRISYYHLRDPERFWQICDANRSLRPANLTDEDPDETTERWIRIGSAVGVPSPRQG